MDRRAPICLPTCGRGITPRSKPHLFYLAFELLGLNRVATGCLISNESSKRSIEKRLVFNLKASRANQGLMSGVNLSRTAETDEYLYAILKRDWLKLHDASQIQEVKATHCSSNE